MVNFYLINGPLPLPQLLLVKYCVHMSPLIHLQHMESGVNEHATGLSSTLSDLHPLECPQSVSFTNRSGCRLDIHPP